MCTFYGIDGDTWLRKHVEVQGHAGRQLTTLTDIYPGVTPTNKLLVLIGETKQSLTGRGTH